MRKAVLVIAAALFGFTLALLMKFASDLKGYGADDVRAEAIVVLTGGKGRAEEGLSLLRKGAGDILILSGVNADAEVESIFLGSVAPGEKERIVLEKESKSTYGNAVEVERLMKERGLKSMVLVTSAYHIKRAELIFRHVLPEGVRVVPYAVSSPNFDEERWWAGRGLWLVTVEFLKYCWFSVRFAF